MDMTVEEIQDLLIDAMQSDFENGVKVLNELAADKFTNDYPEISKAISIIMNLDDD